MKILLYNIAHCRGFTGKIIDYIAKPWRYIAPATSVQAQIAQFLEDVDADVNCLIEVDRRHAEYFKEESGNEMMVESRYGSESMLRSMPLFRNHAVSMLSKEPASKVRYEYFSCGMKRCVPVFTLKNGLSIVLVHLSLGRKYRKKQLTEIAAILQKIPQPYIVCGDFNILKGYAELKDFLSITKLHAAHQEATFPAHKPRHSLDLFLASDPALITETEIMPMPFSDHCAVIAQLACV